MKTINQKLRTTGIAMVTAAAIALPGVTQAGWFSKIQPVKKVTKTVKTAKSSAQDRVGQMAERMDEIYAQLEDNRPLLNAMKNGPMAQQLTEVVQFLNESQYEYQLFAEQGVHQLRGDIHELVGTVNDIGDNLRLNPKMITQLKKAGGLVDSIPATFLYPMAKAGIDQRLQDITTKLTRLSDDLVLIATLPDPQDVYLYPTDYQADLCPLVKDFNTKMQLTVLNARIDESIFAIDTVSGMLPEDLTVNVTVVGGGGATVAKFPPQYIFKAIKAMLGAIKLRVNNYKSVAESMCKTA